MKNRWMSFVARKGAFFLALIIITFFLLKDSMIIIPGTGSSYASIAFVGEESRSGTYGTNTSVVTLSVTNTSSEQVLVKLANVYTNNGNAWITDFQSLSNYMGKTVGEIPASDSRQFSFEFPSIASQRKFDLQVHRPAGLSKKIRLAGVRVFARVFLGSSDGQIWRTGETYPVQQTAILGGKVAEPSE